MNNIAPVRSTNDTVNSTLVCKTNYNFKTEKQTNTRTTTAAKTQQTNDNNKGTCPNVESVNFLHSLRCEKKISEGRDCDVFKGFYLNTNVIVKILKKDDYNPNLELFKNINHANIERVLALINVPKIEYVVLVSEPLVKTLSNYSCFKKDAPSLKRVCMDIASGIAYLHNEQKVAHCDLKQNNVMFSANNTVKIIDFNNVKRECEFGKEQLPVTLPKKTIKLFMDPYDWGYDADIWAFGAMIYYFVFQHELIDEFLDPRKSYNDDNFSPREILKIKNFYNQKIKQLEESDNVVYIFISACLKNNNINEIKKILND